MNPKSCQALEAFKALEALYNLRQELELSLGGPQRRLSQVAFCYLSPVRGSRPRLWVAFGVCFDFFLVLLSVYIRLLFIDVLFVLWCCCG